MRKRIARTALALVASAAALAPCAAHAGLKLFTAAWYTESFGNECQGTMTPGGLHPAHCASYGSGGSTPVYSNWAIPQGVLCNSLQPRCPFDSTPIDWNGAFHPLGGWGYPTMTTSIRCTPLSQYGGGIALRPAKGKTATPRVPPLYRNPFFFTSAGQPKRTACHPTSTGYTTGTRTRFGADKGKVQLGNPIAGLWNAWTTDSGGFAILPAPPVGQHRYGIRTTGQVGAFAAVYPYPYGYTYATLRNDVGLFGPSLGPGSFSIQYAQGAPYSSVVAGVTVKQGKARFGGTMQMLGALTTKVCYWVQARGVGCSLGGADWRYDVIGASITSQSGEITAGYITSFHTNYYNTAIRSSIPFTLVGARFPWTTGSVTVMAIGRGPHKTVHYARGYDNRTPTSGYGTIQLVSPLLTRWLGFVDYETGGIGVLRIQFIPEPHARATLIAGASLLCVGMRLRRR